MKTFLKSGDVFSVTVAPYAATSGKGMLVGSQFGVATADIALNGAGELLTEGVFMLVKLAGEAWTEGVKLYWDDTNKRLTTTASTHKWVATAEGAAGSADTTGRCRLNGVAI